MKSLIIVPLKPGRGYRLLRVGEKLRADDQVCHPAPCHTGEFKLPVTMRWHRMGNDYVDERISRRDAFPAGWYRRRIKKRKP